MGREMKNLLSLLTLVLWAALGGCDADVANRVGTSPSGFIIALKALYGNAGLPADGSSQATIRVEVFTNEGKLVDGTTVTLTTTKGTLANKTLTTTDGVAVTTLTSSTTTGTAFVVATVQNVSATIDVPFVNLSTKAG